MVGWRVNVLFGSAVPQLLVRRSFEVGRPPQLDKAEVILAAPSTSIDGQGFVLDHVFLIRFVDTMKTIPIFDMESPFFPVTLTREDTARDFVNSIMGHEMLKYTAAHSQALQRVLHAQYKLNKQFIQPDADEAAGASTNSDGNDVPASGEEPGVEAAQNLDAAEVENDAHAPTLEPPSGEANTQEEFVEQASVEDVPLDNGSVPSGEADVPEEVVVEAPLSEYDDRLGGTTPVPAAAQITKEAVAVPPEEVVVEAPLSEYEDRLGGTTPIPAAAQITKEVVAAPQSVSVYSADEDCMRFFDFDAFDA